MAKQTKKQDWGPVKEPITNEAAKQRKRDKAGRHTKLMQALSQVTPVQGLPTGPTQKPISAPQPGSLLNQTQGGTSLPTPRRQAPLPDLPAPAAPSTRPSAPAQSALLSQQAETNRAIEQNRRSLAGWDAVSTATNPLSPTMTYEQATKAGMSGDQYEAISGKRLDYSGAISAIPVGAATQRANAAHGRRLYGASLADPVAVDTATPEQRAAEEAEQAEILGRIKDDPSIPGPDMALAQSDQMRRRRIGQSYKKARTDIEVQRRLDEAQDKADSRDPGSTAADRRAAEQTDKQVAAAKEMAALSQLAKQGDHKALIQLTERYETVLGDRQRDYELATKNFFEVQNDPLAARRPEAIAKAREERANAKDAYESVLKQYNNVELEYQARNIDPQMHARLKEWHEAAGDPARLAAIQQQLAQAGLLDPNGRYTPEQVQEAVLFHFERVVGAQSPGLAQYMLGL